MQERPLPQSLPRPEALTTPAARAGQREVHQRADQGEANLALPEQSCRLRLFDARFVVERDAGERQQDHRFRNHAEAARGQHVSALVRADAGQNDADQGQIARSVGVLLVHA